MEFIFTFGNDKYFLEMLNTPIFIWSIRLIVIIIFISVLTSYRKYNRKK